MNERDEGQTEGAVNVIAMSDADRKIERVREVHNMTLKINVGNRTPAELIGTGRQATALIDLLQATIPKSKLAIIISADDTTGIKLDTEFARELNPLKGVRTNEMAKGECGVIYITRDERGYYHCKFGWTPTGVRLIRRSNGAGYDFQSSSDESMLARGSLAKLYRLTGDSKYLEMSMKLDNFQDGADQNAIKEVDKDSYYGLLGLNPYILKQMPEEVFEAIIDGIKKGLVRKLHPDSGTKLTFEQEERLKVMMYACDELADKARREKYSDWL